MNEYGDDLYAQFEAAQRHQHWSQQQVAGLYSWSNIAIACATVFVALAYTGIIQTSPDRLLDTLISFVMRTSSRMSSWLPGGAGMSAREGGALKTVFGLDSGSLRNLSPSGTAMRGFGSLLKGTASLDPPGLGNMSNSCYQNSIIQGLSSLPSLPDFLLRIRTQNSNGKSTNSALLDILDTLNNPSSNGRHFWLPDKLKSMSTWQQQDAQEYYSKILDQLDREAEQSLRIADGLKYGLKETPDAVQMVKGTGRESNTLRNPLEGMLAQRVGCTQCGYSEGLSLIPFNCLTVPLGNQYLYDVRDCLDEYTKLEQIEGVECPKCTLLRAQTQLKAMSAKQLPEELLQSVQDRLRVVEEALQDDDFSDNTIIKKCQVPKKQWVSSTKSKQAVIARPPKCLAVHFNRSLFNEITGAQTKNNASVQFALGLDLDSWCLGGTEDWSMDPTKSMLPDNEVEMDDSTCKYELRAVVTHSGRHENGHYICYRKRLHPGDQPSIGDKAGDVESDVEDDTKESEAWFRLSDEDVNITSVDNVLRQGGVFMLFYERVDSPAKSPEEEKLSSVGAVETSMAPKTLEISEAVQIGTPDKEYGEIDKFTELVDALPTETLLLGSLDGNSRLETQPIDAQVVEYPQIPQSSAEPMDSSDADDSSVTSLPDTKIEVLPDITPSNRIRMRTSGLGSNSSPEDPLKSPGVRMLAI